MKIAEDNVEREQKEIEERVLGNTNIKGKAKQRENWKPGQSVPKPWDEMILGKKEWSSMLKGMVLIVLKNFNSCRKFSKDVE